MTHPNIRLSLNVRTVSQSREIDMYIRDDPIEMAREVGREKYLHLGEMSYPELQRSYMLACMGRSHFDDRPQARIRRHILLNWERGFYKTSIIRAFLNECTDAEEMTKQAEYTDRVPSYLNISGDYTRARLRGSVSPNGKLIPPLIQRPHILFSGELMTLLSGSGDDRNSMINFMCEVLEEGTGRVGLVGMAGVRMNCETGDMLAERGITFNREENVMSFDVEGTFWGATRQIKKNELKILSTSGFLDRLYVLFWNHNKKTYTEQVEWVPRESPDQERLKEINRTLWKMNIRRVEYPPTDLVRRCNQALGSIYDSIEDDNAIPYYVLRSGRDTTNVVQLLTASALNREVQERGINIDYLMIDDWDRKEVETELKRYAESKMRQLRESGIIDEKYTHDWTFYADVKSSINGTEPTLENVRREITIIKGVGDSSAYKTVNNWVNRGWVMLVRSNHGKNAKMVEFLK